MKFQKYTEWSLAWTEARKEVGNNRLILDLWAANIPGDWKRKDWQGEWGYRKKSKEGAEDAGEKRIERKLLGEPKTLRLLRLTGNESEYPLVTAYHNFPLTNSRVGQVISDVLGIVSAGDRQRPLLLEVKVKANNPWYALVECLKQVKLARRHGARICDHVNRVITRINEGAWGLVVAPKVYFSNRPAVLEKCQALLDSMRSQTEARIAFAASDRVEKYELQWIGGNWS